MEAIVEKCTGCGEGLDEQVECSICKAKPCIDCADDSWDHDSELEHPNHRSGALCPRCAPVEEEEWQKARE